MKPTMARIARLERMVQAGEGEQTSLPGLIKIVGHGPVVEACGYQAPGPVTSGVAGIAELWGRNEWRRRADCPDAGECPDAATCRADGKAADAQRRIANPLVP